MLSPDGSRRVRGPFRVIVIVPGVVLGLFALWLLIPRTADAPELPPLVPAGPVTVVGDPRDADPCDLIDPATFPGGPLGVLNPPVALPGTCEMTGDADAEDTSNYGRQRLVTWFAVGAEPGDAPAGAAEPAGAVGVLRPAPSAAGCGRVIALADGTRAVFAVEGAPVADGRTPSACDTAERAVRLGLARLAAHGVVSRPGWAPAHPYDHADACVLLGDAGSAVGATAAPTPRFGRWSCHLDAPTTLVEVDLPAYQRYTYSKGRTTLNEIGDDLSAGLPVPRYTFGLVDVAPSARGTRCDVRARSRKSIKPDARQG